MQGQEDQKLHITCEINNEKMRSKAYHDWIYFSEAKHQRSATTQHGKNAKKQTSTAKHIATMPTRQHPKRFKKNSSPIACDVFF